MEVIETTISEHVFNQGVLHGIMRGKAEGKTEGKAEGKAEGEIRGKIESIREQIANLENLHNQGILSKQQTDMMLIPLRQKLNDLTEQLAKIAV